MIMDEPGPAFFATDPKDDFRISFVTKDANAPGGHRTLVTFRCFEEDKLRGATVWFGERQDLWPEWSEIAQAEGGSRLSLHLVELIKEDSLERFGSDEYTFETCTGASFKRAADPTAIDLSVTLATRSLPIITHAFADARSIETFYELMVSGELAIGVVELAEIALLRGRAALAQALDEIVRGSFHANSQSFH